MGRAVVEKERPPERAPLRQELDYFLQVLGISAFAVAQPILDVMGKSPETFIFRGTGAAGIVLFAVVVTLVPALALSALAAITRLLGPRIRRRTHLVVLGTMTAVIVIQVVKNVAQLPEVALVVLGLVAAGAVLWLLARVRAVGTWARWAAIAPLVFLLAFLFGSPTSKLLRAPEAGAAVRGARPVPVVMLTFDEFPLASLLDRSGRINKTLFPNFARLASRSTWYRNYTVIEAATRYSIPTMLTGKRVKDRSKQPLAFDHPDNLFSLLEDSHRLKVFEPVTALCAEACSDSEGETADLAHGGVPGLLTDALTVWEDVSLPGETAGDITGQFAEPFQELGSPEERRALDRAQRARTVDAAFLRSLEPREKPTLHYFHTLMPHAPWNRFPSGRTYQVLDQYGDLPPGTGNDLRPWIEEEWPVQLARQRLILQVQYTDRLLGRIVERLRDVGMYDDALLIVTSDHGVSLQSGRERRAPTFDRMHDIYWVPLLIKAPGQREGTVDDRNLTATDLLPTIARLLDTEVPWRTDGRSALDPNHDRGPIKRIFRPGREQIGRPEVVLTIAQEAAQRRIRLEAFTPTPGCRPIRLCPYRIGPGATLVGKPLENFTIGSASDLTATLTLPERLRADPQGRLPALILGNLVDGAERFKGRIAVAMNGSIAGVSETWTRGDVPGRFGVLAPEFLVRSGRNDLQLFEVDGSTLRPISLIQ